MLKHFGSLTRWHICNLLLIPCHFHSTLTKLFVLDRIEAEMFGNKQFIQT